MADTEQDRHPREAAPIVYRPILTHPAVSGPVLAEDVGQRKYPLREVFNGVRAPRQRIWSRARHTMRAKQEPGFHRVRHSSNTTPISARSSPRRAISRHR